MSQDREEEHGGANRPDDDSGAGDPDTADGTAGPGGWTPWTGGWELEWPPDFRRGDGRGDAGTVLALAILVGVALFLFPEPVTSLVGLALVAVGLVGLLVLLSRRRSA